METTQSTVNKALEVISNENCSMIVFFSNNEISGMLQLPQLRFSLSFSNDQFWKIITLCEKKLDPSATYKLFEQSDEKYPFIWQLSADIRVYLTKTEWKDICDIFSKTKNKYYQPMQARRASAKATSMPEEVQ